MTIATPVTEILRRAMQALLQNNVVYAHSLASECLARSSSNPAAHHILAHVAIARADFKLAEDHLKQALRRKKTADIYNDLSFCQQRLGRNQEALQAARLASRADVKNPNVLNTLGTCYLLVADARAAVQTFLRAIELAPDSVQIRSNLARAHVASGDYPAAAAQLAVMVNGRLAPNAGDQLAEITPTLSSPLEVPGIRQAFLQLLDMKRRRPAELVAPVLHLIQAEPQIASLLAQADNLWPQRVAPQTLLTSPAVSALARDELFLSLLHASPVSSLVWEKLLTSLRAALALDAAQTLTAGRALANGNLALLTALAAQCAVNEYVYDAEDSERVALDVLRSHIQAARADKRPPPPGALAALASYAPLRSDFFDPPLEESDFVPGHPSLLERQLRLPRALLRARGTIPSITKLDASTDAVREQYEEDPYPFWTSAEQLEPLTLQQFLGVLTVVRPLSGPALNSAPDILIAGCGTGQQSTEAALRFPQSDILAIDLSMASLAFARHRASQYSAKNISFAQADILQLKLDRQFDYIESCGVLHHLPDPMAGWRQLRAHLRPGGIMRVALYSQSARRAINQAREILTEQGLADPTNIPQIRQFIMAQSGEPWSKITAADDFFTKNGFRDLLLHECEHQFTIPMIAEALAELDLRFIGMKVPARFIPVFQTIDPDPAALLDLDAWDRFEDAHPNAFGSMYDIFAQAE